VAYVVNDVSALSVSVLVGVDIAVAAVYTV
jgi:hypothetical protein